MSALTRDLVNQLQGRIHDRDDVTDEFREGVTAMALGILDAIGREENAGKGDLMNPHRGMRVRCRDRAIVLQVVNVERIPQENQADRRSIDVIVDPDGRPKPRGHDFLKEGNYGRQYLRLETWRRWVKGGRILPPASEREPMPVSVADTTDPRNLALKRIAWLLDVRDPWNEQLNVLVDRVAHLVNKTVDAEPVPQGEEPPP